MCNNEDVRTVKLLDCLAAAVYSGSGKIESIDFRMLSKH